MDKYKRHVNKTVTSLSKCGLPKILEEMEKLYMRRDMYDEEKDYIIGNLYSKLTPKKRKLLFGDVAPVSVAAPVSLAPASLAPVSSTAPVSLAPASVTAPTTVPVTTTPVSVAPPVTQSVPINTTASIPTNYNQVAAGVAGVQAAVTNLLDQVATGQNLSGFGRRRRRRF